MWCNESYSPPYNPASNRQYVSWLYDVIDIGEVEFDFRNPEDDENDPAVKIMTVVFLVLVASLGNLLVIISVYSNKAMRYVYIPFLNLSMWQ